jgi:hypothetical protein
LLGEGKLQDAENASAKAVKFSKQGPGLDPGFEGAYADARVKAKSGKLAEARKELEDVQSATRKFGYGLYEYEARLAMAEIESWSGSAAAGAHLAALEKDAKAHGELLVANQAKDLQTGHAN